MKIEFSITQQDQLFRGNSLTFDCKLNFDIDDYLIRCEIFDRFCNRVQLATEDAGGSDDEIEITTAEKGEFSIYVAKDITTNFHLVSYIEIEIEDEDGVVTTVYFAPIQFTDNIYRRP